MMRFYILALVGHIIRNRKQGDVSALPGDIRDIRVSAGFRIFSHLDRVLGAG